MSMLFLGPPGADPIKAGEWRPVGHVHDFALNHDDPDEPFEPMAAQRTWSTTVEFETKSLDSATLAALYGQLPIEQPARSVVIDYVDGTISTEPKRPTPRPGWRGYWDRLIGNRRHQERLWMVRYATWWRMGCPRLPRLVRIVIPRATLEFEPPKVESLYPSDHGADFHEFHAEERLAFSVLPPEPKMWTSTRVVG
jgi:hypothetical protein